MRLIWGEPDGFVRFTSKDAARIMELHNMSDLERMLKAVESLRERVRDNEGREITARDVAEGVWSVKTASQAIGLLSLLHDEGGAMR